MDLGQFNCLAYRILVVFAEKLSATDDASGAIYPVSSIDKHWRLFWTAEALFTNHVPKAY